jgi:hypothetical protein
MHPIVANRRSFGLYVLVWIPLTVLLMYLLRVPGLTTKHGAAFVVPLAVVYAVVCLVAWYPCRATPLQSAGVSRIVATHLAAAAVVSSVWTALAFGYIYVLVQFEPFHALSDNTVIYRNIYGTGLLVYLLFVACNYVLIALERSRESEQHAYEARVLARDAELRALKAQINPHFLFNSLHSISALTTADPTRARDMTIQLADFLRSTLGLGEKTLVPLQEEVALIHRFLAVEQVRFGSRLAVEEEIDPEAMACVVPPLLLQPLVENAITHGIANLPDGGRIQMRAVVADAQLTLTVENDFDPESRSRRKGSGIGMFNVRERLLVRYGKNATFTASVACGRFRVVMSLPAEKVSA